MKKTALWLLGTLCASLGHAQNTVTYQPSSEDFANPERGFYRPWSAASADNFTPLNAAELASNRTTPYTPFAANYAITNTLVYRYYVLDNFKDNAITLAYLDNIRTDLTNIRQAGVKMIVRFAYTITPNTSGGCPEPTACPPYGDAPKSTVLGHIAQLAPIFLEYRDVIAVVQMGFIGIWGEQYYTDYFGDTSPNASQGRLLDNNWQDRIDVLDALLEAVPESRMVQVRYPQIKQKAIYGINAPVTAAPVTAAQAHNGSNIARIGFHNDCFLSSADDFGTYFDYGTSSTFATSATDALKPYFAADSRYTVVGGETCSDGFSPQNDCSGIAVSDMRSLHYSYLNSEFNNEVNNDWQTDGCMDEIKQNLGYRLVMDQGTYAAQAEPGSSFDFSLTVQNVGFAALYNPRLVELVLRNTGSGQVYTIPLSGQGADVRFWLPGESIALNKSLTLPVNVPAGEYALLLNLPDTSNNNVIAGRPEYAIRLANENTWEAATGYNDLDHTLTVGGSGQTSETIGEVGQVTAAQTAGQWRTVFLENTYTDPVVVMGPVSFNGGQPTTVRVRNVTAASFQYQIDEWNYLDGDHTTETVSYLVVEAGTHELGDGQTLVAGSRSVGTGFTSISYQALGQTPVVLTQVTTVNEADAVITRVRNATSGSFQVRSQEEEGATDGGSHADETVAWVAISSGSGDAGRAYTAVRTEAVYRQNFKALPFGASYPEPVLLAALQTYNGSDPAGLRYRNLSASSVDVKVEEETSGDSETNHANEVVGALVFAGSGSITASSGGDPNPTAIVVDGADDDWNNVTDLATAQGSVSLLKAYHTADDLYLLVTGSLGPNNQFYLDADDNGATGYNNAALWNGMGADYLVENVTMFAYAGDGSSFAWNPVVNNGGLVVSKTGNVLELSVPRSTLTGLGSALRIGYSDLDGSFTPVAQLPTSGDMARYTFNSAGARTVAAPALVLSHREKLPKEDELTIYPNPGHGLVTVTYTQSQAGSVRLDIYDLTGRLEKTLIEEKRRAGRHSLRVDAQALKTGVHIVRLLSNGRLITKKLTIQ